MSPLKKQFKIPRRIVVSALVLAAALGASNLSSQNTFAEGSSSFFDANAAQCVVDSYNATTGSSVTTIEQVDFDSVTALNCANRNITHFRGIVLFKNLERLDLTNNTSLATEFMDFSQNTKLKTLSVYNAGNYWELDLSHNPDLEYLSVRPSNGTVPTIKFANGVENLGNDEHGIDLSNYKWWKNESGYNVSINNTDYPYTLNREANKLIFAHNVPYSVEFTTPYGHFRVGMLYGWVDYRIFFEGDEDLATHNPVSVNNNCEPVESGDRTYYYCNSQIYYGDEIDTDKIQTEVLNKIFNVSDYELSKIEIVPPTANIELSTDTDLVKKGIALNEATFTIDFHYALKSSSNAPKTPDTGFFTKSDGSVNLEHILLFLGCIASGITVSLFVLNRILKKRSILRF